MEKFNWQYVIKFVNRDDMKLESMQFAITERIVNILRNEGIPCRLFKKEVETFHLKNDYIDTEGNVHHAGEFVNYEYLKLIL